MKLEEALSIVILNEAISPSKTFRLIRSILKDDPTLEASSVANSVIADFKHDHQNSFENNRPIYFSDEGFDNSKTIKISKEEFEERVVFLINKYIKENKQLALDSFKAVIQRLENYTTGSAENKSKRKNIQTEFIKNSLRKQRSPYAT